MIRPIGSHVTVPTMKNYPTSGVVAFKRPPDPNPLNQASATQVDALVLADEHCLPQIFTG